jgi:hypothetical protein
MRRSEAMIALMNCPNDFSAYYKLVRKHKEEIEANDELMILAADTLTRIARVTKEKKKSFQNQIN